MYIPRTFLGRPRHQRIIILILFRADSSPGVPSLAVEEVTSSCVVPGPLELSVEVLLVGVGVMVEVLLVEVDDVVDVLLVDPPGYGLSPQSTLSS